MTMTNAEWIIKQGYSFADSEVRTKGEVEYGK